jgi:hypothetical protein
MNSEREAQREYYTLREMVAELETDIVKFAGGNNTAERVLENNARR